ncbi:unnamed protein product [Agarophyton chilense]|eukprot:gb/GEZJ01003731.1/.p1 GENE.gb/GEZJ01003731.1/~~gb/GEZJ01003731.1/.p1  ORF type:complete len:300 (-),score=39.96 gb/GEZJ01003731.1/:160-1059(-)
MSEASEDRIEKDWDTSDDSQKKSKVPHTYDRFKTPKRQKIDISADLKALEMSHVPDSTSYTHGLGSKGSIQTNTGTQNLKLASNRSAENDYGQSKQTRTIFVGNIDQKATCAEIKELFLKFGPVDSVKLQGLVSDGRHIPKKSGDIDCNYNPVLRAYVTFKPHPQLLKSMESSCQALNMSVFKNKRIRVLPGAVQRIGKQRISLFVGNLPFDCAEEELVELFKPIAEEANVKLVGVRCNRDSSTGACRGVGFVSFDDILGIRAALSKLGELKIRGRVLRMEQADKKKDKRSKTNKRSRT